MNAISPAKFFYDPFAPDVLKNPVPFYKELRTNHPGYYVEKYDMFIFTRFQDIMDVMSVIGDNTFVGSESTLPRPDMISHRNTGAPPLPATKPMTQGPMLPSPQYEEMRLAHIKPLRPKGIAAIEDFVRNLTIERLKDILPRGKFDLAGEYGGLITATITCHLFGIPLSQGRAVMDAVNALSTFSPEIEAVNIPGFFVDLKKFIIPAIEQRRKAGADGSVALVDGLINHRVKEDGRALTDEEICDQLVCAFVANTETAPKPIANGLLELARHPDQLAEIRADLDKNVIIATEEVLRICTTAQWTIRTAHKDVTVAGVNVKAGQRVLVSQFSAARDEREFGENADQFIWNRPIRRTLSFGFGQHHCIGSHMARLQIRTCLREFLTHVKSYEFDMSEALHSMSYFHWGWMKLPVIIKEYSL